LGFDWDKKDKKKATPKGGFLLNWKQDFIKVKIKKA